MGNDLRIWQLCEREVLTAYPLTAKIDGRRHCAIGYITILVCHVNLQDQMIT